jgi:hypothetical protein
MYTPTLARLVYHSLSTGALRCVAKNHIWQGSHDIYLALSFQTVTLLQFLVRHLPYQLPFVKYQWLLVCPVQCLVRCHVYLPFRMTLGRFGGSW